MDATHQFFGPVNTSPVAGDAGGLRSGTLVDTAEGPRPAQDLLPGDLVWTEDAGLQPLIWAGDRILRLADQRAPWCRPVIIEPDAFGPGMPQHRVTVSPQQLICVGGWRVELFFGTDEVLVPAGLLVDGLRLNLAEPSGPVNYVTLLMAGHHILRCGGLRCASLFPNSTTLAALDGRARGQVLGLFPSQDDLRATFPQTARVVLDAQEARLLA